MTALATVRRSRPLQLLSRKPSLRQGFDAWDQLAPRSQAHFLATFPPESGCDRPPHQSRIRAESKSLVPTNRLTVPMFPDDWLEEVASRLAQFGPNPEQEALIHAVGRYMDAQIPERGPLWRTCRHKDSCWRGCEGPDPMSARIPWIGPAYPRGRVAVVGMNSRDNGTVTAELETTLAVIDALHSGRMQYGRSRTSTIGPRPAYGPFSPMDAAWSSAKCQAQSNRQTRCLPALVFKPCSALRNARTRGDPRRTRWFATAHSSCSWVSSTS